MEAKYLPASTAPAMSNTRQQDASKASSTTSNPGQGLDSASDKTDVKVVVRVRPQLLEMELQPGAHTCVEVDGHNCVTVCSPNESGGGACMQFNWVAGPATTQSEFFKVVGTPTVENCLSGFNASIFAYGQTGSGKTHTMIGQLPEAGATTLPAEAGLIPRIFKYLWQRMPEIQASLLASPGSSSSCSSGGSLHSSSSSAGGGLDCSSHIMQERSSSGGSSSIEPKLKWLVRCSMLEIHREDIYDLLRPGGGPLSLREDIRKGVYVEGLCEKVVENVSDALDVLRAGIVNRQVAATELNATSSRSHCIFTCYIESRLEPQAGFVNVRSSRLHLVDLAGSERLKPSWAAGLSNSTLNVSAGSDSSCASSSICNSSSHSRLRETTSINSSLMVLGMVILRLTEQQPHIPYRNSKLTFLLQDSIGGNAKTVMLATISPSEACMPETLSTLGFAARARKLVNKAVINEDHNDDITVLRQKFTRLQQELALARALASNAAPAGLSVSSEPGLAAVTTAQHAADAAAQQMAEQQQQLAQALQLLSELGERNAQLEEALEFCQRERSELERSCLESRQELTAVQVSLQQAVKENKGWRHRWFKPDKAAKAALNQEQQQQQQRNSSRSSISAAATSSNSIAQASSTFLDSSNGQSQCTTQQQLLPAASSSGWSFSSMFGVKRSPAAHNRSPTPPGVASSAPSEVQQQQPQDSERQERQQEQPVSRAMHLLGCQLSELAGSVCADVGQVGQRTGGTSTACVFAETGLEPAGAGGMEASGASGLLSYANLLELQELQLHHHQSIPELSDIVSSLRRMVTWQQQRLQQQHQHQQQQRQIEEQGVDQGQAVVSTPKSAAAKVAPSELHRQLLEERQQTAQLQAQVRQLQQELLLAGGPAVAATVPLPATGCMTSSPAKMTSCSARLARLSPGVHYSADAALSRGLHVVPTTLTAAFAAAAGTASEASEGASAGGSATGSSQGTTAADGGYYTDGTGSTAAGRVGATASAGDPREEPVLVQVRIIVDDSSKPAASEASTDAPDGSTPNSITADVSHQQQLCEDQGHCDQPPPQQQQSSAEAQQQVAALRAQVAELQEQLDAMHRDRNNLQSRLQSARTVLAAARCSTPCSMLSSSTLASPQPSFSTLPSSLSTLQPVFGEIISEEPEEDETDDTLEDDGLRSTVDWQPEPSSASSPAQVPGRPVPTDTEGSQGTAADTTDEELSVDEVWRQHHTPWQQHQQEYERREQLTKAVHAAIAAGRRLGLERPWSPLSGQQPLLQDDQQQESPTAAQVHTQQQPNQQADQHHQQQWPMLHHQQQQELEEHQTSLQLHSEGSWQQQSSSGFSMHKPQECLPQQHLQLVEMNEEQMLEGYRALQETDSTYQQTSCSGVLELQHLQQPQPQQQQQQAVVHEKGMHVVQAGAVASATGEQQPMLSPLAAGASPAPAVRYLTNTVDIASACLAGAGQPGPAAAGTACSSVADCAGYQSASGGSEQGLSLRPGSSLNDSIEDAPHCGPKAVDVDAAAKGVGAQSPDQLELPDAVAAVDLPVAAAAGDSELGGTEADGSSAAQAAETAAADGSQHGQTEQPQQMKQKNEQQQQQLQSELVQEWHCAPAWSVEDYEEEVRQLSEQLQELVSNNSSLKAVLQQRDAKLSAQQARLEQQGHDLACCEEMLQELQDRLAVSEAAAAASAAEHCDAMWAKGQVMGLMELNEVLQGQLEAKDQELELRAQELKRRDQELEQQQQELEQQQQLLQENKQLLSSKEQELVVQQQELAAMRDALELRGAGLSRLEEERHRLAQQLEAATAAAALPAVQQPPSSAAPHSETAEVTIPEAGAAAHATVAQAAVAGEGAGPMDQASSIDSVHGGHDVGASACTGMGSQDCNTGQLCQVPEASAGLENSQQQQSSNSPAEDGPCQSGIDQGSKTPLLAPSAAAGTSSPSIRQHHLTANSSMSRSAALQEEAQQQQQATSPFKQLRMQTERLRAQPHNVQVAVEQAALLHQQLAAIGLQLHQAQLEAQLADVYAEMERLQHEQQTPGSTVACGAPLPKSAKASCKHPSRKLAHIQHEQQPSSSKAKRARRSSGMPVAVDGTPGTEPAAAAATGATATSSGRKTRRRRSSSKHASGATTESALAGAAEAVQTQLLVPAADAGNEPAASTRSNGSPASTPCSSSSGFSRCEELLEDMFEDLQVLALATHQSSSFRAASASTLSPLKPTQQQQQQQQSTGLAGQETRSAEHRTGESCNPTVVLASAPPASTGRQKPEQQQEAGAAAAGPSTEQQVPWTAEAALKLQSELQVASAFELAAARGLLQAGAVVKQLKTVLGGEGNTKHSSSPSAGQVPSPTAAGDAVGASPSYSSRGQPGRDSTGQEQDSCREAVQQQSPTVARSLLKNFDVLGQSEQSEDELTAAAVDVQQTEGLRMLQQLHHQQQHIMRLLGSIEAAQQSERQQLPDCSLAVQDITRLAEAQQQLQHLIAKANEVLQPLSAGSQDLPVQQQQQQMQQWAEGLPQTSSAQAQHEQPYQSGLTAAADAGGMRGSSSNLLTRQQRRKQQQQQQDASMQGQQQQQSPSGSPAGDEQQLKDNAPAAVLAPSSCREGGHEHQAATHADQAAHMQQEVVELRGRVVSLQLQLQEALARAHVAESISLPSNTLNVVPGKRLSSTNGGGIMLATRRLSSTNGGITSEHSGSWQAQGSASPSAPATACPAVGDQTLLLSRRLREMQACCVHQGNTIKGLENEIRRQELQLKQQALAAAAAAAAAAASTGTNSLAAVGALTPRHAAGSLTPRYAAGAVSSPRLFSPQGTSPKVLTPRSAATAAAATLRPSQAPTCPASRLSATAGAADSPLKQAPGWLSPRSLFKSSAVAVAAAAELEGQQQLLCSGGAGAQDLQSPGAARISVAPISDTCRGGGSCPRGKSRGIRVGASRPPLRHAAALRRTQQ